MREQLREWGAIAAQSFEEIAAGLAALTPRLLGAAVLLIAGWLIARLLRALTLRLVRVLDRLLSSLSGAARSQYQRVGRSSSVVLSTLVFWLVILVSIAAAAGILGLDLFTRWVDEFFAYLPTLVAGAAIILVGVVFGGVVRTLVSHAAASAQIQRSDLLGRLAQIALVATAIVIGAGQLGINVTFLTSLATVAVAAFLGAFALGLALGTPAYVSNFIGARLVRARYHEGERVRIDQYTGTIVAISNHAVVMETEGGEVTVPARMFSELPTVKLVGEDADDEH